MSSYLLAKGVGESLNEDSYEVRIIRTAAGSDQLTEFSLAANGFALRYESVEDSALVPGIVHSRCEVTTLWPAAIDNKLDTLLTGLATSEDGDYLLEVLRDSTRIWVGSILVEEFSVDEDSTNKEVRIVATDCLSLLKHVDYNNSGTAYTGYQTVYDIVKNIQEKWSLYTYLNEQNSGTEYRLAWAEDVYSEDDYVMAAETHPAGTDLKSIKRSRIHTNPWSSVNSSGATEYISCYDLLQSLCITYQWRLYSYGDAWHLLPVALAGENTPGTVLQWDGTEVNRDVITQYDFQKDAANDVRQKDAAWRISYTPPHNEVRVTRDTSDGASVISAFNFASGVEQTDASLTYEGSDTAPSDDLYLVHGRIYIVGSALGVAEESIGNIVLKNVIKWDTGGSALYYGNSLSENVVQQQGLFYSSTYLDTQPIIAQDPVFSASANTFFHVPQEFQGVYQPSIATSRYIDFEFIIPPPTSEKTGLSITPSIVVFDNNAALSSTYLAALSVNYVQLTVQKWSNNQLELINDFDIVANATTGRGTLNLGRTYVGALAASMGQITVQTSAGVYGTSNNWVCQDNDDNRAINTLAVEETLQRHNKPKGVERGSIVLRGTSAAVPMPFNFYKDLDTGTFYAPVNWQLNATACEVDVTLRITGRDAISVTTQEQSTGKGVDTTVGGSTGQEPVNPLPNVRGYNKAALQKFSENWSGVIGSETLEAYFTVLPDGTGRRIDSQGDSPPDGYDVSRKIYFKLLGLQGAADGFWNSLPVFQPSLNDTLADAFELIDLYMAQLTTATAGAYSFLVTYSEVANLVLDNYTGAQAAFSLRKLRAGYTGNCIKVRRSSDNTTQDIGFNSSLELDTAALLAFCGSGDGFVHTWYDQSTFGRDAVNTSTGEQPKIVSSGSVIQENGKPAVEFDGSNDNLITTATWAQNPNGALNTAVVCETNSFAAGQFTFNSWDSSTTVQVWASIFMDNSKGRVFARYANAALPRPDSTNTLLTGEQYIITSIFDGNTTLAYYNGVEEDDKFSQNTSSSPRNSVLGVAIGARLHDQIRAHNGTIQEAIVWSNSSGHDADDLSEDINDYYGAF